MADDEDVHMYTEEEYEQLMRQYAEEQFAEHLQEQQEHQYAEDEYQEHQTNIHPHSIQYQYDDEEGFPPYGGAGFRQPATRRKFDEYFRCYPVAFMPGTPPILPSQARHPN